MTEKNVPDELKRLFAERTERFRQIVNLPLPEAYRFGQIWTARAAEGILKDAIGMVVLLEDEGEENAFWGSKRILVTAPISLELSYRSRYDLMLSQEESPLNYPFMIEVWNRVSVCTSQLDRYVGTLQQPIKRFLGIVCQAHLGVEVDTSEVAQYVGPAILNENDPRITFQEREIKACDFLRFRFKGL